MYVKLTLNSQSQACLSLPSAGYVSLHPLPPSLCLSHPSEYWLHVATPTAPRSLHTHCPQVFEWPLRDATLIFIFLDLFYLMCMSFPESMYVYHMHA